MNKIKFILIFAMFILVLPLVLAIQPANVTVALFNINLTHSNATGYEGEISNRNVTFVPSQGDKSTNNFSIGIPSAYFNSSNGVIPLINFSAKTTPVGNSTKFILAWWDNTTVSTRLRGWFGQGFAAGAEKGTWFTTPNGATQWEFNLNDCGAACDINAPVPGNFYDGQWKHKGLCVDKVGTNMNITFWLNNTLLFNKSSLVSVTAGVGFGEGFDLLIGRVFADASGDQRYSEGLAGVLFAQNTSDCYNTINWSYNDGVARNWSEITGLGGGGGVTGNNLTITAQDAYDSITLTNYSIFLQGATNVSATTLNGTILINNVTHGFFNITFFTDANGSYFNRTYLNLNVSGQNFKGNLTQSYVNLFVNDSLIKSAISSFSYITNFSSLINIQGGNVTFSSKSGTKHFINVSSSQYPSQSISYSIDALQNLSITINMSPTFQHYLRREADNSIFDVNGTNTTRLTIFCPDKNIQIYFKNASNGALPTTKVSTQENSTVDCAFTLMKMDVTYAGSSYFRSLIPEKTQQNVTWWLLDLNKDTGVQIIINLVDLSGEFSKGLLRLRTAISGTNEDIIEQNFDISTSIVLYLLKDALYQVIIRSTDGTQERQLGDLIADAASTKTITFPNINFIPDNILSNNISWTYTFNASANILRLQYSDTTKNTTFIRWRIYNGSANISSLLTTFTGNFVAGNFSLVTFTYNSIFFNSTYYSELFAQHSTLGYNISEFKFWGEYENYIGEFKGFTAGEAKNIRHYVSAMFLVVWGLLFSAKHIGIGLTSTFFWVVILKWIGWFLLGTLWIVLIGIIAVFGWVYEAMRRT